MYLRHLELRKIGSYCRWVDDEFISLDEDVSFVMSGILSLMSRCYGCSEEEQSEGGEAEEEASPDEEEQEEEEVQEDGKEEQKEEQKEEVPEPEPVEKVVPKSKNVIGSTSVKRVEALTSELTKNVMEVVNDLQSQIDSLTVELGNKTKEVETSGSMMRLIRSLLL